MEIKKKEKGFTLTHSIITVPKQYYVDMFNSIKPYLSENVNSYLDSVLNLDISVLSNKEINIILGNLKEFREIALYNIFNRTEKVLNELKNIDTNKLKYYASEYNYGDLNIDYNMDEENSFCILNCVLNNKANGDTKLPFINVYDVNKEDSIVDAKNVFYKPAYDDVRLDGTPLYGGPGSQAYRDNKFKHEQSKKRLNRLDIIGDTQEHITNITSNALFNDWNINKNECENLIDFSQAKTYTKRIGWITINRKTIDQR